jgi:hypothetical protein
MSVLEYWGKLGKTHHSKKHQQLGVGWGISMARIRYLKPEFFEDEQIGGLSLIARLLYLGMFCHLDKSGIAPYSPRLFKARVFAFDDEIKAAQVESAMEELVLKGRLKRFALDGQEMVYCPTFKKHQLFHKNERSKYSIKQEEIDTLVSLRKNPDKYGATPEIFRKELVIGNGELVIGNGQRELNIPETKKEPEIKRKAKPKETPESLRARANIRQCWIDCYRKRYGFEPSDTESVFVRSTIKKIHEALGENRSRKAIEAYLNWDNPRICNSAHPIWQLLPSLDSLRADISNPKAKYTAIARGRAAEKVMTETEQRLEEMKAYARRDSPELLSTDSESGTLDFRGGQQSGGTLSDNAKGGIPEERSALHNEHAPPLTKAG